MTLYSLAVPSASRYARKTTLTALFCISFAFAASGRSPFCASISPVTGLTTSCASSCPSMRFATESFLLYLYLPTLARSYFLYSKNVLLMRMSAPSIVGTSPGRRRLKRSVLPCSSVLQLTSLAQVAAIISSPPKRSISSSSVPYPSARSSVVAVIFLVRSTCTSFWSCSNSSHAPLLGMTVVL